MKKSILSLGKVLNKSEQIKIEGGFPPGNPFQLPWCDIPEDYYYECYNDPAAETDDD
ncbi:conserved hypothetical protein [Tenacibaculum sp. 190524A05c]|uniref:hypothetical protein n=1 Tax=Tenacibaculum platacis TaxID=3137852 RepID=UPI0031FB325C